LIKRFIQFAADVFLIVTSFLAAMVLRLETMAFEHEPILWVALLPVVPVTIIAFRHLGLYRAILRFITGRALRAIGIGVAVSVVGLIMMAQLTSAPIPRSVPIIYGVLLFLSAGGLLFSCAISCFSQSRRNGNLS
jgi:FlaA1/EpsC-like NDP-sugar epimerase